MRRFQDKALLAVIAGLLALNIIQGIFNAALYSLTLWSQYKFQEMIDLALKAGSYAQ